MLSPDLQGYQCSICDHTWESTYNFHTQSGIQDQKNVKFSYSVISLNQLLQSSKIAAIIFLKRRFLLFQVYRNFANLFSKLYVSTFYKLISKFQQKVQR